MRVSVNGEERELDASATVLSVLEALDVEGGTRGVAVALDAEVVPRGEWGSTKIENGARIEVLRAIQGG